MKVMSFNVQNTYKKPSDKKINEIIELINEEEPDIIGLQELTPYMKTKIEKQLKGYVFFGRPRLDGIPFADEYNTLVIKRNIQVTEVNTYSLSRRPNKVRSKNFLSAFPRICTTVVCIIDGKKVKVANTHLDHLFDRGKNYQLSVIYEIFRKNDYPLLIMGDFNMGSGNKNLKEFADKMNLQDTCHDLGKTCVQSASESPIDHIFADNCITVKNAKKIDITISDHFPIVCEIEIKKN